MHSCDHDCWQTNEWAHCMHATSPFRSNSPSTPLNNPAQQEFTSHFFIPRTRSQFYKSSTATAPPFSFIFTLLRTATSSWLKEGVTKPPLFSPAWPPTCNLGNGGLEPAAIGQAWLGDKGYPCSKVSLDHRAARHVNRF